ncbi:MAG TPA: lanthionine synthetase C family protein [Candidatus Dormibacteraeota bacterium]
MTETGAVTWRPPATGELARRAEAALASIQEALAMPAPDPPPSWVPLEHREAQAADLAGGAAGLALFHAQLALAGDAQARYRALELVEASMQALAELTLSPALLGGFTGIAWSIDRVQRSAGGAGSDLSEIDAAVAGHLDRSPWLLDYDLVSGLAGFAVYALDRLPEPGAALVLERVLDRLDELAVVNGDRVAWHTPPRLLPPHQLDVFPAGCWNLGLAHGVPGVVAVLARMVAAGFGADRARTLLDGGVNWLLAQRGDGCPAFPSLNGDRGEVAPGRLAWCYGDPGVCLALLAAGTALERAEVVEAALGIARAAAVAPFEASGVADTGLCHGAAGLAHVFNRLYQATGDEVLASAARRWLQTTLDMRRPGEGVAGFPAWEALPEPHWAARAGLLEGAAGVGLALAAAVQPAAPIWDDCLLMGLPCR